MASTFNNVPVAVIDPNFLSQLNGLKDCARRIYSSSVGSTATLDQRKWQIPVAGNWDGNLFNISGATSISAAYDRSLPNLIYVRALTKGPPISGDGGAPEGEGRDADCMVEKIQIDYLAVQERAFRLRHQTSIRCSMHAAARRSGHSTLGDGPDQTDLGAGVVPTINDVSGPVGGIFTSMIRYLKILLTSGYLDGPIDILHSATVVHQQPDGTVYGTEG